MTAAGYPPCPMHAPMQVDERGLGPVTLHHLLTHTSGLVRGALNHSDSAPAALLPAINGGGAGLHSLPSMGHGYHHDIPNGPLADVRHVA